MPPTQGGEERRQKRVLNHMPDPGRMRPFFAATLESVVNMDGPQPPRLPHRVIRAQGAGEEVHAQPSALHANEQKFVELPEQTVHKIEIMRREYGGYLGAIAQAGRAGRLDASRIFIVEVCSGSGSHLILDNPRGQGPGSAVQACIEARSVQHTHPYCYLSPLSAFLSGGAEALGDRRSKCYCKWITELNIRRWHNLRLR